MTMMLKVLLFAFMLLIFLACTQLSVAGIRGLTLRELQSRARVKKKMKKEFKLPSGAKANKIKAKVRKIVARMSRSACTSSWVSRRECFSFGRVCGFLRSAPFS